MIVHKLLYGDGAATYLPFALSRLRALEAIDPGGFFSQTFTVDDATINVRQEGEFQYLKITVGGGFYFEFVSTGNPVVVAPAELGGSFYNAYSGVVVSTDVTAKDGEIVLKPTIREQRRMQQDPYENFSITGFPIQVQYYNETGRYIEDSAKLRAAYKFTDIIYSTPAPYHSYTGLGTRSNFIRPAMFTAGSRPGTVESFTERDYGYDMLWGHSTGFTKVQQALVEGDADWPRVSGQQIVTDESWGTRTFCIIIDTACNVQIFPRAAITPLTTFTQNVNPDYVKQYTPAFPSWCRVPNVKFRDEVTITPQEYLLVDQPEINWEIHPEGTYAIAVIYARAPFLNDAAYYATDPDPDTPWTQTKFDDQLIPILNDNAINYKGGTVAQGHNDTERWFHGAGVIELEFKITLTGAALEDFEAEVVVHDVRDPYSTTYSAVLAGYSHIDITGKGVAAGDALVVDFETYGLIAAPPAGVEAEHLISIKNLSQADVDKTEVFCSRAHPIIGVDLSTCSLALKVSETEEYGPVSTPMRPTYTGGSPQNVYWVREQFAVWIVHSGGSKGIIYPDTMPADKREWIASYATADGRAYITALLEAHPTVLQLVPLAHPNDDWATTDVNTYRDYWSRDQHFWYREPWVIYDPDYTFHGTSYPTQGYVRYRTDSGYVAPPNIAQLEYTVLGHPAPMNSTNEHLMLCAAPKWGWYHYASVVRKFLHTSYWTTFFTHPNGSYAFWNDQFIYNQQGLVDSDHPTSGFLFNVQDALSIFDVTQLEHCIFDRVHLEVKGKTGTSASVDTTFMQLYNDAVEAGLQAGTLEAGIETTDNDELRGVFTKEEAEDQLMTAEHFKILDLKFTWNGREYWFPEPGMMGPLTDSAMEPLPIAFPPTTSFNLIGLNLTMFWFKGPKDTNPDKEHPSFVNIAGDPTTVPFRFTNPLIVTG